MTPLRQQGLSLIEVMIALAVFSFGLLALAALMASGLKYNTSALHRSYATSQAYDMAGSRTGPGYVVAGQGGGRGVYPGGDNS